MTKSKVYEIKAPIQEIEPFLTRMVTCLKKSGYEERVHLHEPRQRAEILEFTRKETILSIEVDRQSLGNGVFRISSSTGDPDKFVLRVLSGLCADLVATFIRPIAGRANRKDLEKIFSEQIESYIGRKRTG